MKRRAHRESRQGIKRYTNSSKQARHEAPKAKKGSKRARAQETRRKQPDNPAVMNPRQGCAQNNNLHGSIKQAAKSNQRTTKQTRRRKTQPHMTGRLAKIGPPHEERSTAGKSKRDKTGHRAAETKVHDESRDQESNRERPGARRAREVSFNKKVYILEFEQKGSKKKTRSRTRQEPAH